MKINKKFLIIIIICFVGGLSLSLLLFNVMKKAAEPEKRISVLVFSKELSENTLLTKNTVKTSIKMVSVPESLVPKRSVKNIEDIYDMTLIENVTAEEYVLIDFLTERGKLTFDADEYWQVSIDVTELTNFLGLQLKRGKEYQLFYRAREKDRLTFEREDGVITDRVYIVDLIDNLGNKVFEERDENIKSVILAMESKEAARKIVSMKDDVSFELIKAPVNYYDVQVKENKTFDQDEIVNEILKEKQDRRRYM